MSVGIRIKDLQNAESIADEFFDDFRFALDAPKQDTTLYLSGSFFKRIFGKIRHAKNHFTNGDDQIKPSDIGAAKKEGDRNQDFESKTLTTQCGLVGEFLRSIVFERGVHGFNLSRDELGRWLLEVDRIVARESLTAPELVKNRVTVANNQTWFADNGIIEAVAEVSGKSNQRIITVAKQRGGACTFQLDDLLKGIYLDEIDGALNFQTVRMTVIDLITPYTLRVSVDQDTPPPREELIIVRTGNRTNVERQNSIFIDGARPAMFYYVNVDSHTIGVDNIAQATGNLKGFNFGRLTGGKPIKERFSNVVRGNNYQSGKFLSISGDGIEYPVLVDRGVWDVSRTYYHYEMVSHCGEIFTCAVSETRREPSHTNTEWTRRVEAGEDTLSVFIYSHDGTVSINGAIDMKLTAELYRGSTNISDTIAERHYSWVRVSSNLDTDKIWNEQHQSIGRFLILTRDDVFRSAMFECSVCVDGQEWRSK